MIVVNLLRRPVCVPAHLVVTAWLPVHVKVGRPVRYVVWLGVGKFCWRLMHLGLVVLDDGELVEARQ